MYRWRLGAFTITGCFVESRYIITVVHSFSVFILCFHIHSPTTSTSPLLNPMSLFFVFILILFCAQRAYSRQLSRLRTSRFCALLRRRFFFYFLSHYHKYSAFPWHLCRTPTFLFVTTFFFFYSFSSVYYQSVNLQCCYIHTERLKYFLFDIFLWRSYVAVALDYRDISGYVGVPNKNKHETPRK